MDSSRLALRPAAGESLAYAEQLLADSGLPTDDIREDGPTLYLAVVDGTPVGVGGLEVVGRAGLLRSVAVAPDHRGRGVGTAICERLEARAADAGVTRLYLLTTDAAVFFAGLGYEPTDRGAVPTAIAETPQFRDLCPDSATCMAKRL